jgi:hypothetical protein
MKDRKSNVSNSKQYEPLSHSFSQTHKLNNSFDFNPFSFIYLQSKIEDYSLEFHCIIKVYKKLK